MANDKENISKFIDMTKGFKSKYDALQKEVISSIGENIGSALKNYAEMQDTYSKGFVGIISTAQKADGQLLESFDKHYAELKTNVSNMQSQMKKNANEAIDGSLKQFQTQCEELLKKHPQLPEKAYKDVLQQISASKGQVNSEIDKRFRDVLEKVGKNFAATRKELTMPEIKPPKVPPLDANLPSGAVDSAKQAYTTAKQVAGGAATVLNTISKNMVGTSKPAEKK